MEQLPYRLPSSVSTLAEMVPAKSSERTLPVTDITRPYFERHLARQEDQKWLMSSSGQTYYDNDLVIAKPNGVPDQSTRVSANFGQLLQHQGMPHMRFHDTRHSAATNMHKLTGDVCTISQIPGHSLKGIGIQLYMSNNPESAAAQYVHVHLNRKTVVSDTYHIAVLGPAR